MPRVERLNAVRSAVVFQVAGPTVTGEVGIDSVADQPDSLPTGTAAATAAN